MLEWMMSSLTVHPTSPALDRKSPCWLESPSVHSLCLSGSGQKTSQLWRCGKPSQTSFKRNSSGWRCRQNSSTIISSLEDRLCLLSLCPAVLSQGNTGPFRVWEAVVQEDPDQACLDLYYFWDSSLYKTEAGKWTDAFNSDRLTPNSCWIPFFILEHLTPLGLELKEELWLSLTLCGEGRDTLRQGPPSHLSQGENKAGS